MKRLYTFVISLLCGILAVNAQATFTAGKLLYSVNDDGVSVTVTGHVDGDEATGSIDIPDFVSHNGNDYPVTRIGYRAFANTHSLHGTLTIGNNVTEIGYAAFVKCDSLSGNLIIPNSVEIISAHAFNGCHGFTGSLTIPPSVTKIYGCAFMFCIGFDGTLTIPNSVDFIGSHAFEFCSNFTKAVSLAEEPPALGYDTNNTTIFQFDGFGCSTLIVPCGSKTKYENSPWHDSSGGFSTFIEDCENVLEVDDEPIPVVIDIFSLDGRFVKSQKNNLNTIDISSLNAGFYVIKVKMSDGKEFSEKIVVK
ncbi:MAG: leucine-rich repeat domain-containing protein [Bacteroidales bacterium]|nr:leucine-rich repeat domain-containing protein [Bacteroidales bacterium]